MDRTGRALGTLRPVIYLEDAAGHLLLLPEEIGQGQATARELYQRYKARGYEWREAGTLEEVDELQGRLTRQEQLILDHRAKVADDHRERVRRRVASNLRQQMMSSACTPYERDFIQAWLMLEDNKREQFTQRWNHRQMYLWAREMDESTRVEDRMK
jgi:hypothetical protein